MKEFELMICYPLHCFPSLVMSKDLINCGAFGTVRGVKRIRKIYHHTSETLHKAIEKFCSIVNKIWRNQNSWQKMNWSNEFCPQALETIEDFCIKYNMDDIKENL